MAGPAGPRGAAGDTEAREARRQAGRSRRRSGRDRRSKQVGRYLVCVHVQPHMTQIAMLEGRSLVEHYVSRAADDTTQIDGNVYRGRVQNVLPGMEAAFVDIGIPKNAVLYRGDVRYDKDDIEGGASPAAPDRGRAQGRADHPVPGHQEPHRGQGRPAHPGGLAARALRRARAQLDAFGISKRLGDNERRRLRRIIDEVKPAGHGMIVRTAAEGVSADELQRDVTTLRRAVERHRGRGQEVGRSRACSTASPTWRCASCARSSTPSTGAWSSTTARCSSRCATT